MADMNIPGIPASALPLANSQDPGMMSAAQNNQLAALDAPITVPTALVDSTSTINPANDGQSRYVMAAGVASAARVKTLGTTGTPMTNETVWLRINPQTFTITIRNGGANGTAIPDQVVPVLAMAVDVGSTYDGSDWIPHTVIRVS